MWTPLNTFVNDIWNVKLFFTIDNTILWIPFSRLYRPLTFQMARFTWPTWGPPGSCQPQVGSMNLAIRVVWPSIHYWWHYTNACHSWYQGALDSCGSGCHAVLIFVLTAKGGCLKSYLCFQFPHYDIVNQRHHIESLWNSCLCFSRGAVWCLGTDE